MYPKDIPEQRREQLINAAFEAMNGVSLAGISLSQVAKEAGLSTGIVSHYFGDKEGLLNATLRKILRDRAMRLRNAAHKWRATASLSCSPSFRVTSTLARAMRFPCAPGSISGPPACISRRCAACSGSTIVGSTPISAASFVVCCPENRRATPLAAHLTQMPLYLMFGLGTGWSGDMTYLRTAQGWLYLTILMDSGLRKTVSWSFSDKPDGALAIQAFRLAVNKRRLIKSVVSHSDQGAQYTRAQFQLCPRELDVTGSMSRKDNCLYNAVTERVLRSLKAEIINYPLDETRSQDITDIIDDIDSFFIM